MATKDIEPSADSAGFIWDLPPERKESDMNDQKHGEGFINMGYAVICDNCDRRHNFPQSGSVEELKEDMKVKGIATLQGKHFCNEDCQKESIGEICLHVYSRDNDRKCIKCGEPEILKCLACGKEGSIFCNDQCENNFCG